MQPYLDAIRNNVCNVCLDAVMQGEQFVRCGLPKSRNCPVEIFLPKIIDVVEAVDSWRIDDYIKLLREKVCAICKHSDGDFCALRLQADCPLDRYFMLVAEAIKNVNNRLHAETATVGIP